MLLHRYVLRRYVRVHVGLDSFSILQFKRFNIERTWKIEIAFSCNFLAVSDSSTTCPDTGTR